MMEQRHRLLLGLLLATLPASAARADRVTLENGTMVEGDSIAVNSMTDPQPGAFDADERPNADRLLLIDKAYKRYIVPLRQVADDVEEQQLVSYDFFELSQNRSSTSLNLATVGLPREVTPFDEHGIRTVTLAAPGGRSYQVVQGITRISPEYVTVEGISHSWWQGISTKVFPGGKLVELLHTKIDRDDPDERLSVARFLIQAGRYELAAAELLAIAGDFPDLESKVAELKRELDQLRAKWLLSEVRRRREAGQHQMALGIARAFPTQGDFDADVMRQVETLRGDYRTGRERADEIVLRLGELEAELEDPHEREVVAEMRLRVGRLLDWSSLSRFDAFLTLAEDSSLPAADRLALAYSGWMTGSAGAVTNFPQTLALWEARWLVSEYLGTSDVARQAEILSALGELESIGPSQIAKLIAYLPPWEETSTLQGGRVNVVETRAEVPGWGGEPADGKSLLTSEPGPVRYAIALPPGYTATRTYPLLVALRPAEWSIETTARFWGLRGNAAEARSGPGPATEAGFIVIAPEYADADQVTYNYSAREHLAMLAAIRDAKSRLMVDSNRVYLAGHGMGADATFDLSLSQPHLFAAAAPISGLLRQQIVYEKTSPPRVPLYVVNGQRDRNARGSHGETLAYMMYRGHDIIYCEYVGRGYEYYPAELENIIAWMKRFERIADPSEIKAQIARTSDARHYWLTAEAIPTRFFVGRTTRRGVVPNPLDLETRISQSNTITIKSPAQRYILRLNEALVNFDERVRVNLGTRQKFNDYVEPRISDLLENLKESGDRQRLYPVRLRVE